MSDKYENFAKDFGYDSFEDFRTLIRNKYLHSSNPPIILNNSLTFEDALGVKHLHLISLSIFNNLLSDLNIEFQHNCDEFSNLLGYKNFKSLIKVLVSLPSVKTLFINSHNKMLRIYLK